MNEPENGYHISLFKPTTERARFNRNLVIWLASIWFVAIFGFQIALRILQKPTPEASYIAFENVWPDVRNGTASEVQLQEFGFSVLSVLGKVAIDADERAILDNAISWTVYEVCPDSMRQRYVYYISEFEALRNQISNISEPNYVAAKKMLSGKISPMLGLAGSDPRTIILPLELTANNITALTDETVNKLPPTMEKYLIHNQSVLTDKRFLGFPFHYFYTAVFLLILFVGLCLVYCLRSDRRNAILGIED